MKIVHVIPSIEVGGLQKFAIDLSNVLGGFARDLHIVVLNSEKEGSLSKLCHGHIKLHYLNDNGYRIDISMFWKLFRLLKKLCPSSIQLSMANLSTVANNKEGGVLYKTSSTI